jgi:hypothetical protein
VHLLHLTLVLGEHGCTSRSDGVNLTGFSQIDLKETMHNSTLHVLHTVFVVCGVLPWIAAYLAPAILAWRSLRQGSAPTRSAAGVMADSMGKTFCAMWLLAAPCLMLFLMALLRADASALWGFGGAFAYFGLDLLEKRKSAFIWLPLLLVAFALFCAGLSVGMPN